MLIENGELSVIYFLLVNFVLIIFYHYVIFVEKKSSQSSVKSVSLARPSLDASSSSETELSRPKKTKSEKSKEKRIREKPEKLVREKLEKSKPDKPKSENSEAEKTKKGKIESVGSSAKPSGSSKRGEKIKQTKSSKISEIEKPETTNKAISSTTPNFMSLSEVEKQNILPAAVIGAKRKQVDKSPVNSSSDSDEVLLSPKGSPKPSFVQLSSSKTVSEPKAISPAPSVPISFPSNSTFTGGPARKIPKLIKPEETKQLSSAPIAKVPLKPFISRAPFKPFNPPRAPPPVLVAAAPPRAPTLPDVEVPRIVVEPSVVDPRRPSEWINRDLPRSPEGRCNFSSVFILISELARSPPTSYDPERPIASILSQQPTPQPAAAVARRRDPRLAAQSASVALDALALSLAAPVTMPLSQTVQPAISDFSNSGDPSLGGGVASALIAHHFGHIASETHAQSLPIYHFSSHTPDMQADRYRDYRDPRPPRSFPDDHRYSSARNYGRDAERSSFDDRYEARDHRLESSRGQDPRYRSDPHSGDPRHFRSSQRS